MKIDVIVTRHQALIDLGKKIGIIEEGTPVLAQANEDDIRNKTVFGVLPMHLAAQAEAVVTIDLALPFELRGKELSVDEMLPYIKNVSVYRVSKSDWDRERIEAMN